MPVVPMKQVIDRAFADGYGVAAFNVVNDLTLEAVLAAATELRAPVIVQTSVKTVKSIGLDVLYTMWEAMTRDVPVPVTLHLDHCPDREVISACLERGWNSVLFDASSLPVEENRRQTIEVVAEARRYDAHVEGEIEGIQGVEDDIGSDEASARQSLEVAVDFVRATGVDCFAPAIGNAHGVYRAEPTLDAQRVSDIVAATGVPIALHGGTGMTTAQFQDLIGRGCAKVNISTALKVAYMGSNLEFTRGLQRDKWDPPSLFRHVRGAVMRWPPTTCAASAARAGPGERLVFDCDGVLADTERYGHCRRSTNLRGFGLPCAGRRRNTGGGWRSAAEGAHGQPAHRGVRREAASPPTPTGSGRGRRLAQAQDRHLQGHGRQWAPARRAGVARVIGEAIDAGWPVAVASTSAGSRSGRWSSTSSRRTSRPGRHLRRRRGPGQKDPTGHLPARGEDLELDRARTWWSRTPATAAGRGRGRAAVCGHREGYTRDQDLGEAVLVVSSLGDPGGEPVEVLANRSRARPGSYLTLADLEACLVP